MPLQAEAFAFEHQAIASNIEFAGDAGNVAAVALEGFRNDPALDFFNRLGQGSWRRLGRMRFRAAQRARGSGFGLPDFR